MRNYFEEEMQKNLDVAATGGRPESHPREQADDGWIPFISSAEADELDRIERAKEKDTADGKV